MIKHFFPANRANLYTDRGILYDKLGNDVQALSDYNMAIEIYPPYAEAYMNRGISYFKTRKFAHTISDFNKAIELKPDYKDAYFNRGLFYFQMKEYAKSRADLYKAEELGAVINPAMMSVLKKLSDQRWQGHE